MKNSRHSCFGKLVSGVTIFSMVILIWLALGSNRSDDLRFKTGKDQSLFHWITNTLQPSEVKAAESIVFTSDTLIDDGDMTYEDYIITVGDGTTPVTLTVNGTHLFDNLTIRNNAVVVHSPTDQTSVYAVNLTIINNLDIEPGGSINVDGRGYLGGRQGSNTAITGYTSGNVITDGSLGAAGGSHGGAGGYGYGGTIGSTYGDPANPDEPGAGGGAASTLYKGGNGGGLILLQVSGTLTVDGRISADGVSPAAFLGGGGAGGAILIDTGTLAGNGDISANGGDGGIYTTFSAGGGGGGRIAIYYSTDNYTGNVHAYGSNGQNGGETGGAGTVFWKSELQANGDLVVDNNNLDAAYASTPLPLTPAVFDSITVTNRARVLVSTFLSDTASLQTTSLTLTNEGHLTHEPATITAVYKASFNITGDMYIDSTSAVDLSGRGYLGGRQGSNTAITGYTSGNVITDGSLGAAGGSHGGAGGDGYGGTIGTTYGDPANPDEPGAGGGAASTLYKGGNGGGLILLQVSGTLTVDGRISADGVSPAAFLGGGGAGGAILIDTGTLAGNGDISANGGDGGIYTTFSAGGGGGGRIAIYYSTDNYTGNVHAYGSNGQNGGETGGAGTVFWKSELQANGDLVVDNNNLDAAYASTPLPLTPAVFDSITVTNRARVLVSTFLSDTASLQTTSLTLTNEGHLTHEPATITAVYKASFNITGDMYIDSTSAVDLSGRGYLGGRQGSNTAITGYTSGNVITDGSLGAAGGSHGGAGGDGYGGTIGTTYGDPANPDEPGAGGGAASTLYKGGNGGGLILLQVSGTLTVDGRISADGVSPGATIGGGGAGGAILIDTGTLAGNGDISANGGDGGIYTTFSAGGGGGGRIAIYYSTDNYTGNVHVDGGIGQNSGGDGQPGTIYQVVLDGDNDGVPNSLDTCPGTPAGEAVDANGCSASQLDDDGDGVPDSADSCPGTPAGEAVDANGCSASQVDADNDGVPDSADTCPGTPAGEAVDANGCSASQLDTDNDGVPDSADTCPGTPAGEAVDANGCSASQLDDDGDGVPDSADSCPGTPAGEAVDANGCSASQVDADNDGVPDSADTCPGTPAGEAVDANGCSASQLDTDNDGVPDSADTCPGTPAGEAVDANGCSASQLDDDGDGVPDSADSCPGTPAGEAVDANGCSASQVDADNDGVPDSADTCPGTPAGEAVDANGCSISQVDADNDGVPNSLDTCPGTPAGEAVDANGCSASQLDDDGDGVPDSADSCPGTPAGEAVDANGCSASQVDADNDGVPDSADSCPGTPAGEAVDANGCSASQLDDDGDGVPNSLDTCPGTPAGEAVDANGCSASQLDTDNDGVSDSLDTCSGTPAGEAVDANGCSASQVDADNDGVPDSADTCPGTPAGEAVDTNGCSASQVDADNDGVPDSADTCPGTPAGEPVDGNGCALSQDDIDGDGVTNDQDLCPGTPAGMLVDIFGCSGVQSDNDADGVPNYEDLCPGTPLGESPDSDGCTPSQRDFWLTDDDNDGVINGKDPCPNTPLGAPTLGGCASNQLDGDKDGVPNLLDACPFTQIGLEVDRKGCGQEEIADDNDGVPQAEDLCPNTRKNFSVDAQGCAYYQIDSDGDGTPDYLEQPSDRNLDGISDAMQGAIASAPTLGIAGAAIISGVLPGSIGSISNGFSLDGGVTLTMTISQVPGQTQQNLQLLALQNAMNNVTRQLSSISNIGKITNAIAMSSIRNLKSQVAPRSLAVEASSDLGFQETTGFPESSFQAAALLPGNLSNNGFDTITSNNINGKVPPQPAWSHVIAILLPPDTQINSYFNFGPTPDNPDPHLYEFLFDGTTGAVFVDGGVVLYFADGQRGDHDLTADGNITTLGFSVEVEYKEKTLHIVPKKVKIKPSTKDRGKLEIKGEILLSADSNGIDPAHEDVFIQLFHEISIYPNAGSNFMPVSLKDASDGWHLSSSEKKRTGIQTFKITRTDDPDRFQFMILHNGADILPADYRNLRLDMVIGDDWGSKNFYLDE